MNRLDDVPPRFDEEFLEWFRVCTERYWQEHAARDFMEGPVGGHDFQLGTRWLGGLSDAEIAVVENRWQLRFPPDYRLFLRHLHSVDRPMKGARFSKDHPGKVRSFKPSFFNWLTDADAIQDALSWPLEGLYFDLHHNVLWHESWGHKPDSLEEQKKKVKELVAAAPPLIPLKGHAYLLGEPVQSGNPVLSVYQSDNIFYGIDLRYWLLLAFGEYFCADFDYDDAYSEANANNPHKPKDIPFWGEFLEYNGPM